MERWQDKVIKKAKERDVINKKIDFRLDEGKIKDAFSNIYKSLGDITYVNIYPNNSTIEIFEKTYTLHIDENKIYIEYKKGNQTKYYKYMIDECRPGFEKKYTYTDSNNNGVYNKLEGIDFDYELILNELMKEVVEI